MKPFILGGTERPGQKLASFREFSSSPAAIRRNALSSTYEWIELSRFWREPSRGEILALFLLLLSQSNARTATVLVDELDASNLIVQLEVVTQPLNGFSASLA
jgi:hypothetical protein